MLCIYIVAQEWIERSRTQMRTLSSPLHHEFIPPLTRVIRYSFDTLVHRAEEKKFSHSFHKMKASGKFSVEFFG